MSSAVLQVPGIPSHGSIPEMLQKKAINKENKNSGKGMIDLETDHEKSF